MIVLAEKSDTSGTHAVFQRLFGFDFEPGQDEYHQVSIHGLLASLFYMNLSEMRFNSEYAEKCQNLTRDTNVLGVICFEYCNPRVQEIDQNIRELRKVFDVDTIRFVFYTGENNKAIDRSKLVAQMRAFLECQYVDNLDEKVYLLDEHLQLTMVITTPIKRLEKQQGNILVFFIFKDKIWSLVTFAYSKHQK